MYCNKFEFLVSIECIIKTGFSVCFKDLITTASGLLVLRCVERF